MDKQDLLEHLMQVGGADAIEVAQTFRAPYPAVAMMLLRLLRQGLLARYQDEDAVRFWYELTPKGVARLRYFRRLS